MPNWSVKIDDVDLGGLAGGIGAEPFEGWADPVTPRYHETRVPGRTAAILSPVPEFEPRVIRLRVFCRGTTYDDRRSLVQDIDALTQGTFRARFADRPDRHVWARRTAATTRALSQILFVESLHDLDLGLEMTCDDPVYYAENPSVVSFGSSPAPLDLGDLPSVGVTRLLGPATNPELRLTLAGQLEARMRFTVTVAADEHLRIDHDLQTATLVDEGTGAEANAFGDLNSEDGFLAPDPELGTLALAVTAGTGYHFYRKAYSQ